MAGKKPMRKQTISAKVTVLIKEKIDKEAKEKGVSTSEHLASILDKHEEQKKKLILLEKELTKRDEEVKRLQDLLDALQNNLTTAQKLQNRAEMRAQEINDKYLESIEEKQLLVADVEIEKSKTFLQRLFNR